MFKVIVFILNEKKKKDRIGIRRKKETLKAIVFIGKRRKSLW
jgi:hypothetical protein